MDRSVLVIDDDSDARALARFALEYAGWHVDTASGAEEALERIKRERYDVVTLDLRMPGTDGYDLLPILRREAPDLPVIVISAEPREVAPDVIRAGADDFLAKPYSVDELAARVDRLHQTTTEHHQVQAALADATDLLETLPSINIRLDADGTVTWVSATVATVLGHDPSVLVDAPLRPLIREPDEDDRVIAAALDTPRVDQRSTIDVLGADGDWHRLSVNTVAMIDPVTGATTLQRTMVPTTPRAHPADSRQQAPSLVDASPVPTLLLTGAGHISAVNERFTDLLGYAPGDVAGLRHQAFVHPDDVGELARLETGLRSPEAEPSDVELRYVGTDGRVRWIHLHIGPFHDPERPDLGAVAHLIDVDAKHHALANALVESLRDPLTGLPNRAVLGDRLDHALAGLRTTGGQVTVLFIDLDHLKEVNDTLGHQAGDHLLATVGSRLSRTARATDTVARLGGDEFVIVATDLHDLHQIESFSARLLQVVAEPIPYGSNTIECTASIGCAYARSTVTARTILEHADSEMYRAKRAGRDRYAVGGRPPIERISRARIGAFERRR